MNMANKVSVLFDFDGVIMDTESQYTVFWNEQGRKYLDEEDFGSRIKGQTLKQIYEKYFFNKKKEQESITDELNQFEEKMHYSYVPGVEKFMDDLRSNGVKTAIVTSSNKEKMQHVYRTHPELKKKVDYILTGEMFAQSKPAPDCFLLGMEKLNSTPACTYVFEDSFHGLQAGTTSGAVVIGVATTNSRETITGKAHCVIDDFIGMTYEKLLSVCR